MLGIYFLLNVSLIEEVQTKMKLFENVNTLCYTFDSGLFRDFSAKNIALYASQSFNNGDVSAITDCKKSCRLVITSSCNNVHVAAFIVGDF